MWINLTESPYRNDSQFGVISGRDTATTPIAFRPANRGKHLGDLLWTTGHPTVASNRMIDVLRDVGATGWRSYPIEIILHLREHRLLEGYQGLAITGRHESIRFARFEELPEGERDEFYEIRAIGADPAVGWDGSDLFAVAELGPLGSFWVTDRVHQALLGAGVDDFRSTPDTAFEHFALRTALSDLLTVDEAQRYR